MSHFWKKKTDDEEREQIEVHEEMVRHLQLTSRQTDNILDIADQVLLLTSKVSNLEAENQILRDKITTLESKDA